MEYVITDLTPEMVQKHNPDLFKKIKEGGIADEQVKTLSDELEAQKVVNEQLSEENEKLKKDLDENKTMLASNLKDTEELKKENDIFKAEKAQVEKEVLVAKKLSEAKLPEHLVTDFFRESLLSLDEEGIDKAIAERKQIAGKTQGRVENMGDEFDVSFDDDKKKEREARKKRIIEQLDIG